MIIKLIVINTLKAAHSFIYPSPRLHPFMPALEAAQRKGRGDCGKGGWRCKIRSCDRKDFPGYDIKTKIIPQ
ncbi:MAG: hypothetical protein O8C61_11960 [Candidatus Methanoperedens sp.]|nr:hypothetical protein [Candidatus Methanoperedens sp.]